MARVSQLRRGRYRVRQMSGGCLSLPFPPQASGRGFCLFVTFYSDEVTNLEKNDKHGVRQICKLSPDLPINISLPLLSHSLPHLSLPPVCLSSLCLSLSLPPSSVSLCRCPCMYPVCISPSLRACQCTLPPSPTQARSWFCAAHPSAVPKNVCRHCGFRARSGGGLRAARALLPPPKLRPSPSCTPACRLVSPGPLLLCPVGLGCKQDATNNCSCSPGGWWAGQDAIRTGLGKGSLPGL